MNENSVFHDGEQQVQERAGETFKAQRNGVVISGSLPRGAHSFIRQQSLAIAASIDADRHVWASLLIGRPGFLSVPNDQQVEIDLDKNPTSLHDPLWQNIGQDPKVGLLIIDLATRRRLRINGNVLYRNGILRVGIKEAYPNCPKYIQRRSPIVREDRTEEQPGVACGLSLESRHLQSIGSSDTLFVASQHPDRGLDASHRGGLPGFVRVIDDRTLRVPDYPGNGMFNTLGNFAVTSEAGLAFLDFEKGTSLQLTGQVEILWDQDSQQTGGTGRSWEFRLDRWIETQSPHRIEWEFLDYSHFNPNVK